MISRATRNGDDTGDFAAAIAEVSRPGDLIVLIGGLGAGKTRFVRGFARAMGFDEPVTSPTFALVHIYEARMPIFHADLYRLASEHEVLDLGLDEALEYGAIALVEWGDIALDLLAPSRLVITIADKPDGGDEDRLFALEPVGASWAEREEALDVKTRRWQK